MFFASLYEDRDSIMQNTIRPPSKLEIGNKFNIPRKSEDKIKSCPNSNARNGVDKVRIAHNIFMAGPAMQMNISFENEPRVDAGTRDAPNGDKRISLNLTLDLCAAAI